METREAFLLRLPSSLKKSLEQKAIENRRSTNSEAQVALEAHVGSLPEVKPQ
jgi:hypothetical protein